MCIFGGMGVRFLGSGAVGRRGFQFNGTYWGVGTMGTLQPRDTKFISARDIPLWSCVEMMSELPQRTVEVSDSLKKGIFSCFHVFLSAFNQKTVLQILTNQSYNSWKAVLIMILNCGFIYFLYTVLEQKILSWVLVQSSTHFSVQEQRKHELLYMKCMFFNFFFFTLMLCVTHSTWVIAFFMLRLSCKGRCFQIVFFAVTKGIFIFYKPCIF